MLNQNFPNPFNSTTNIRFSIINKSKYKLEIFNSLGKKVNNAFEQELDKGNYGIMYDAQDLSTGVYFYRLSGDVFSETKKFILIK